MTTDKKFIQLTEQEVWVLKKLLIDYRNGLVHLEGTPEKLELAGGLLEKISHAEDEEAFKKIAAQAWASIAGATKSEAKAKSAREAGKLGGRPANPERDCEIYRLIKGNGWSVQEVADHFNLTKDAVYKILERVRKTRSAQLTESINKRINENFGK